MTFTRQERSGVFACGTALLTLTERDPECSCTWVPAEYDRKGRGRSTFVLKYRHESCRAYAFHRKLDEQAAS